MGRKTIIAGNWKMHKSGLEAFDFIEKHASLIQVRSSSIYLAVPFSAIPTIAKAAAEIDVVIGAQNMHDAKEGAFTGEVSAEMLREVGAKFVLLGHSERRQVSRET